MLVSVTIKLSTHHSLIERQDFTAVIIHAKHFLHRSPQGPLHTKADPQHSPLRTCSSPSRPLLPPPASPGPPSCPAHKTRHLPSFSVLSTTFMGVTHCAHLGTIPVIQGGELFITQIPGKEDLKMSDRLTMIIRRGIDKEKAYSKAFLELIPPSLKPYFLFRPACQRCIKQTAGSHSHAYGHCCPFLSESPMCPQCVCDIFCDFPKPLQAP